MYFIIFNIIDRLLYIRLAHSQINPLVLIKQKDMTFDHDFGYSLPSQKKEERRKGE